MKINVFKTIILLFMFLFGFNAYANTYDFNFIKNNVELSNITSKMVQNDNFIYLELNGKIKIAGLEKYEVDKVLNINNSDITSNCFASYFIGNVEVEKNIELYSSVTDNGYLESKIVFDNKVVGYVNGNYVKQLEKNIFVKATESDLIYGTGLGGITFENNYIKYPFELNTNSQGLLETNFMLENINYQKNENDYISNILCDFKLNIKLNKENINAYNNLYILVSPLENVYLVSNRIILSEYLFCNHDWQVDYSVVNKDGHTEYCKKCKWSKIVNHEYVNAYDDLNNNQCVCGYNKKAHIHIYDSEDNLLYSNILNTFSAININNDFFDVEKYEIDYIDEYEYAPQDYDYANSDYSYNNVGKISTFPDKIHNLSLKFVVNLKEKLSKNNISSSSDLSNRENNEKKDNIIVNDIAAKSLNLTVPDTLPLNTINEDKNQLFGASSYNSSVSHTEGSSSSSSMTGTLNVAFSQAFQLKDYEVKMTQDDNYYYFDISSSLERIIGEPASLDNSYGSGSLSNSSYMLYKEPNFGNKISFYSYYQSGFADWHGTRITRQTLSYNGTQIYYLDYRVPYSGASSRTETGSDSLFYPSYPYPYFTTSGYSAYNSKMETSATVNQVKIQKSSFDAYRYFCFAQLFTDITSHSGNNNYNISFNGYSYCSDTIDLNNYIDCEHNWIIQSSDDTTHTIKCSKCEWEKKEEHDFKYEYDGIKNDLCVCGLKKEIKIHSNFNSDLVSDTVQTIKTNATYTYKNNPTKTGYTFKNFKKYTNNPEKPYSETTTTITKAYVGNVTTMDTRAATLSIIYEAQYDPVNYIVKLDKTNNKSLSITISTTEYKDRKYDTEYALPTLTYAGYKFLGWTKTKGSESVDIAINTKYKNLTTKNGEIITLYPVFKENEYIFKFSKINNLNLTITTDIKDLVCGYGTTYNLPDNIEIKGYIFLGWSLTKSSETINFNKNAEINNFTTVADKEYILYPVYEPQKYTFKFSKINNLNLTITTDINDLICDYGTTYNLPDNIEIAGYKFIGWTFTKGSTTINFGENAMIKNYTDINNKEYIIYPVYDYRVYTIKCNYKQEGTIKSILLENVRVAKKTEFPKIKILPITKKGYGWYYEENEVLSSLDIDNTITKDDETIIIEYKLDDGASAYTEIDFSNISYTIKCEYFQEIATKSIILEKVVIGIKRELQELKVLPITSQNYGWYYGENKVTNSLDVDKYVTKNNETIVLIYKLDAGSSAYTESDFNNISYTIKCEYWQEKETKIITLEKVVIGVRREFPIMKVLPITKKGYGWYYEENEVLSSLDIDKYVTKNNEVIILKYKTDDGASAYTDDIKDFIYTIKCEYWQETATKSIIIKDVKIGSISELPKIKILPITAKSYGWFYKENKVVSSLDVDQYVVRNNEIITLHYRLDKGVSAYTDDINDFIYTIKCEYWQETATKSIIIKDVKIGSISELPKIKILPITAKGYGWFYKENKVVSSLDVDQYVVRNNEIITLHYRLDKGASAYTDDIKDFIYTIKCEYFQETATKSIIIKDVKIGSISELPKLKVLPLSVKAFGWYYGENKVLSSLNIDKYVAKNNEIIRINYVTEKRANCYASDKLNFKIKYNANLIGYGTVATTSIAEIGSNKELLKLDNLPDNIHVVGWYRDNKYKTIKTTGELEQFIAYNNQIIQLYLYWHFPTGVSAVSHNSGKGDGGGSNKSNSDLKTYNSPNQVTEIENTEIDEPNKDIIIANYAYVPIKYQKKEINDVELEQIFEDIEVQGHTLTEREKFYLKYGIWISDKEYDANYHNVEVINATKWQILFMNIIKMKWLFIFALVLGAVLLGVNIYYEKRKKE